MGICGGGIYVCAVHYTVNMRCRLEREETTSSDVVINSRMIQQLCRIVFILYCERTRRSVRPNVLTRRSVRPNVLTRRSVRPKTFAFFLEAFFVLQYSPQSIYITHYDPFYRCLCPRYYVIHCTLDPSVHALKEFTYPPRCANGRNNDKHFL